MANELIPINNLISLIIDHISMETDFAVNQRRSYDGSLCTIRYVGRIEGTSGDWLGVEWDNPTRGKHSGEHNGVRYFTCIFKPLNDLMEVKWR